MGTRLLAQCKFHISSIELQAGKTVLWQAFYYFHQPNDFALAIGIKVRDNESIDRALRRFKRAVNRSRVLRIYRDNMAFTKPSEERREAKERSYRNSRRYSRAR